MNNNWQIEIYRKPATSLTDIYIFRRVDHYGQMIVLIPHGPDKVAEERTIKEDTSPPPSITIPNDLLPLLLDALMSHGIKSPEQSFIQGKLEATENHLKDMRKLLKLS